MRSPRSQFRRCRASPRLVFARALAESFGLPAGILSPSGAMECQGKVPRDVIAQRISGAPAGRLKRFDGNLVPVQE
jgi:hypothetical protein